MISKVVWVAILSICPLPIGNLTVLTNQSRFLSNVPPLGLHLARCSSAVRLVNRIHPLDPSVFLCCGSTWQYLFSTRYATFVFYVTSHLHFAGGSGSVGSGATSLSSCCSLPVPSAGYQTWCLSTITTTNSKCVSLPHLTYTFCGWLWWRRGRIVYYT